MPSKVPSPGKYCTSTPNSSVRSRSTSPVTVRPPEPLSINSTLQSRERLYIHPLQWVPQHLRLLECQFRKKVRRKSRTGHVESRVQDEPTRSQQQRQAVELSTEAIIRAADHLLLHECLTTFKVSAVRYLLEDHGIRRIKQVTLDVL